MMRWRDALLIAIALPVGLVVGWLLVLGVWALPT